jgi:NADH-quinone oxidoreductase subunit J
VGARDRREHRGGRTLSLTGLGRGGEAIVIQAVVFYLFSAVLLGSAAMVIAARNPVHSVLFLILAFFNAAGLFVLMGAEFLAMILVVVYVGAVAVLFLFVVMMLDINFVELREGFMRYLPIGALVGLVLLAELALAVGAWVVAPAAGEMARGPAATPDPNTVPNTLALGRILYTDYAFIFQASGLVLLVAMIGAIVLTLRHREGVRRQVIARQVTRRREESVVLVKVKPRQGVS